MKARVFGVASITCLLVAGTVSAGVKIVSIGDAAPPSVYAGRPLTPFASDPHSMLSEVSSVLGPGQRIMFFQHPTILRRAGVTWGHWGHGYTGDVYHTNGQFSETLVLPPYTTAFVIYAVNNGFGSSPATVTCSDGTSTVSMQTITDGDRALGWVFYATEGKVLQRVTIENVICDFGFGEMSIMTEGTGGCSADLTGDGLVDFSDYLEFLNRFDGQDLMVDYTQDGQIDFGDYLEFLNAYDAGC